MHGSLVTSSLIRETTENESANEGYRFGQEEENYNIVAAHGYFGRLILPSIFLLHYHLGLQEKDLRKGESIWEVLKLAK
jgi:hypothetical protein